MVVTLISETQREAENTDTTHNTQRMNQNIGELTLKYR